MLSNLRDIKHRILVTGSRGKSSLTRLLHAAFNANGLSALARVTGVIPRELYPGGERVIERSSPGHIREMEWWASQIKSGVTKAIVMENSAVDPEFQPFASDIIGPTMAVWTNCRPDHEELWGAGSENACRALLKGIPKEIPVACGFDVGDNVNKLKRRGNEILLPVTLPENFPAPEKMPRHTRENIELALAVCAAHGFPYETSLGSMISLPLDIADFQIIERERRRLAAAFSANDTVSTSQLFESTNWKPEETTLLYHHRADRAARLTSFMPWINSLPWKRRVFTRNIGPFSKIFRAFNASDVEWNDDITDARSFINFWEGQVFGCGNVAGWPLDFLLSIRRKEN